MVPRDGVALELGPCCTGGEAAARMRESDGNSGHLLVLSVLIITLPVTDFAEIGEELGAQPRPKIICGCTTGLSFYCWLGCITIKAKIIS